ncbi:MAG: beta-ketoacyl-[acyl-carrier-protein] synthase family protein [Mariniblastus sp.]
MNSNREVVISGVGAVSSIGIGIESFWNSLISRASGVSVREPFADSNTPFRIAAPVRGFDAKQFVKPRKAIKIMCAPIQFGCAAASMAIDHAGIDRAALTPERIGTVFGTETFFADPAEVADVFRKCTVDKDYQHDRWGEFAVREIQPLWMLKYLPNMAASHISIALDARGPSNSICQGEVSGLLALIEAADLIRRNAVDVVLTGGTGSQMALTAMLCRGAGQLTKRVSDPEKASRPFDVSRDGMVVGEGAGALVLESAEHARARGATPLATLAGWSRSYRDVNCDEFATAIGDNYQAALRHSDLSPQAVGLINANASGSVRGDRDEATAINHIFGSDTPVVAHKGNFGNTGPGTSILELIGGVLTKQAGVCPATINCENLDPDFQINVQSETTQIKSGIILKSSFSSTGQIASVVLR